MLKVAFYKGKGDWIDSAIRLITRGKYSHCEVILTQDNGANLWYAPDTNSPFPIRCKSGPLNNENWDIIEIPKANIYIAERFCKDKIGSEYDFKGVFFSMLLRLNIQTPHKWSCQEFAAACIKSASTINLSDSPNMYSPSKLYKTLKDKGL